MKEREGVIVPKGESAVWNVQTERTIVVKVKMLCAMYKKRE